jgi:integrase
MVKCHSVRLWHLPGTDMSNGVEVRGGAVRVYFRYDGRLCRERYPGPATESNLKHAEAMVKVIQHEIQTGTFNYGRHFPKSRQLIENTFGHYLDLWLQLKAQRVAPSTMHGYRGRAENHIRPRWGTVQIDHVDHIELELWLQALPLQNKTLREVLSIMRQVFRLHRRRVPTAPDPTEDIRLELLDQDDPDPFTRSEIDAILAQDTDRPADLRMIKYMMWDGPRFSEAIALGWDDVDLKAGTITYRRSYVRDHYRVTKTKRSKRTHQLLAPARQALEEQYAITGHLPPREIDVLERDNRTLRQQEVRFVWLKQSSKPLANDDYLRRFFKTHLELAGVRYRGPGQCRHTFASQMLTSGIVPIPWLVEHMGHTTTEMLYKRYAKWIREDAPDIPSLVNRALRLE